MVRVLALLLLVVWTAGYARCAAELAGAKAPSMCCTHEEAGHEHAPLDQHTTCGMCKMIAAGSLLSASALMLASFVGLVVVLGLVAAVLWLGAGRLAVVLRLDRLRMPPLRGLAPRLAEFLARTACPVRGPTLLTA